MMIIDAHVHLPVEEASDSLQQKKDKLFQEMKKNQVDKCIVISDSSFESTIGSMDDCVKLFKDTQSVYVVGGISPFVAFKMQLEKLKEYLVRKLVVGIKLFTGHEEFYLSSADWMPRNLDRRIELLFPVEEQRHKERLQECLNLMLSDNRKARIMNWECVYSKTSMRGKKPVNSHEIFYQMAIEESKIKENKEEKQEFQPITAKNEL